MINKKIAAFFIGISLCGFLPVHSQTQPTRDKIAVETDIAEDIKTVNCKNSERLNSVKNLFVKLGAKDGEIKVEKIEDVENVVVVKKGKTDEKVIVGAHYDKTADGCGAIDNWTGIVILANLYRTLSQFDTEKTFIFAAFGKEELGLLGSDEMAKAIPKEKRTEYCAMVNFDSFGLTYPQVMTNISDTKLISLAEEVSKEMKLPFSQATIEGASSDAESFRKRKIPSLGIHALNNKWRDYLHSSKDKAENINTQSVYVSYRYGLAILAKIDAKGCQDFRKSEKDK